MVRARDLAHLARHHSIFLERLRRILRETAPQLHRYSAEEDPEWREWSRQPGQEILRRLGSLRAEIIVLIKSLSPAETARVGTHPLFGEMSITGWEEFFLLHEAHHL